MSSTRNLSVRELLRLAKYHGLSVKQKGTGHIIVVMPDGHPVIFPASRKQQANRHLDFQIKRFREMGLLDTPGR